MLTLGAVKNYSIEAWKDTPFRAIGRLYFIWLFFLIFSLCGMLPIKQTRAADWTIKSGVSQRFEADDNLRLLPKKPGGAVGSITNAGTEIIRDTPGQRLKLYGDIELKGYAGSGAESNDNGILPKIGFDWGRERIDRDFHLFGSMILRNSTDEDLIREIGPIDARNQLEYYLGTSGNYKVNSTNQLSIYFSGTSVQYSDLDRFFDPFVDPFLDSYSKLNASTGWNRKLSETSDFAIELSYEKSRPRDLLNNHQSTYTAFSSYSSQVSEQLAIEFGIGISAVYLDAPNLSGLNDNEATVPVSLGFEYQHLNTELSLVAEHKMDSDTRNGLARERSSLDLGLSYLLNTESRLNLVGAYERTGELFGESTRDYFSVNPSLTRNLGPGWTSSVGYLFRYDRYNDNLDTEANSNKVYITFSKLFNERHITTD